MWRRITNNHITIKYFIIYSEFYVDINAHNPLSLLLINLSSGVANRKEKEAGVGFTIKEDIATKLTEMAWPVSDRIMKRLPLSKDNFATIICVYAPTMTNPDENLEAFYKQLDSIPSGIPRTDKLLLLIGDCNARIGRHNDKWHLVMGKHGIGKCNSNVELLLAFCSEFELIVTNTIFK